MVDSNLGGYLYYFEADKKNNIYCLPAARLMDERSSFGKSGELNFTSSVGGNSLLMVSDSD